MLGRRRGRERSEMEFGQRRVTGMENLVRIMWQIIETYEQNFGPTDCEDDVEWARERAGELMITLV